jgi:putative nucleotidyltransferase with HDIG domain
LETIKALVLSIHAFSQFANVRIGAFSIDALWAHSQSTAGLAKEIARLERAEQRVTDEAFVAGLLHDTGKLVLASNFASQYNEVLKVGHADSLALLAAEEAAFGANHAEVGAYLLGLWGLPAPVVEAIALHHQPSLCKHLAFTPLTAAHVADALAHVRAGGGANAAEEEFDLAYLRKLGLAERVEVWRKAADTSLQPAARKP